MRRNRLGGAVRKLRVDLAAGESPRSPGRVLTFQALEDRYLLDGSVTVHKDDGSITKATDTTGVLTSGQTVTSNSDIGTGPYGATTGDFDFYKVFIHSGQLLTLEINAESNNSPLDSIVAVYDSQGNYLDSDDDSPFNTPFTLDSYLQFTPATGGFYYVAVGQYLQGENVGGPAGAAAFPSNPFDSSTGPGSNATTEGPYELTMTLAAYTPVAPVASDILATTNEGTAVQIPVLDAVADDGIVLPNTVVIQTQPADGKASVNTTTGVVTYTPNPKFYGVDTFNYTVTDYDGLKSNIATVTVDVNQVITPPVAVNDSFTVNEDTPTVLNILANDTDQNDTIVPTSVLITTQPAHGSIGINPTTGAVTYTPSNNYLGADSFQYTVADNAGAVSNIATVTLHVVPAPPVANPDTVTTPENTPVTIDELANDVATDATLVPSSVAIVTQPTNGTASINPTTGAITYTPNLNYVGPDTIKYTVKDTNGSVSNVGTISINVTFVDYPPVAVNDIAQTNPITPVAINVLANDTDQNNDIAPGTVAIKTGPSNGTAVVNPTTGVVTYTPNAGFSGNDSFTYTVATTHGAVSNAATVSIRVHQPPIANPDTVTTLEQTPVTIDVLANDTDPEGATILPSSVTITTQPAHGTVSVDPSTGNVLYSPAFNYSGTDTFQYTIADTNGVTSLPGTVTINITFVPKAPVAANDVAGTAVNTPVTVNVLANDIDYDSTLVPGSVTIASASARRHRGGERQRHDHVHAERRIYGADQLTYTVKDALGLTSNAATLQLRVGAPVSFSGVVYVDSNDNGVQDPGEVGIQGVTITLTKTDGPVTFSLTTTTAADGSYSFAEVVGQSILPAGTYTLTESPTVYFVDGKDTPGNVPATVTQDQFSDINLAAGQSATGFNFGELGLKAQYVAAYYSRRAFFASSTPEVINLNLSAGSVYFALSSATQGTFTASAQSSGQGSTQLTLYNGAMQALTSATIPAGQTQTSLSYNLSQGAATLLVVSGSDPQVSVSTSTTTPGTNATSTPIVSWHNSSNPLDVNGDGLVTALDALIVINALNSQGPGPLGSPPVGAHDYLDVTGTGSLSAIDALEIINELNSQASAAASSAVASPAVAAPALAAPGVSVTVSAVAEPANTTNLSPVAFTLASQTHVTSTSSSPVAASQTILAPSASTAAPVASSGSQTLTGAGSPTTSAAATNRLRQAQATDAVLGNWGTQVSLLTAATVGRNFVESLAAKWNRRRLRGRPSRPLKRLETMALICAEVRRKNGACGSDRR